MTNPVSSIPSAQLPVHTEQIVDEQGNATILFHRFLTGLYERTGGAVGVSSSDANTVAQQALATATEALAEAELAQSTAASAQSSAAAAQTLATTAEGVANSALNLASIVHATAMIGSNNLSELTSATTARRNLGINTVALNFAIDTLSASLLRGLPIMQSITVPANFAGAVVWWGVAATADTVLTLRRYRGGSYLTLGTLTYINHGAGYLFSTQPAFSLVSGDVLVVQCPSVPDATLAQISFTISASLA